MKKLILFDIDGTLIWTDGAGRAAIRQALLCEMGVTGPIEGFRFDGKTDPQIIRELLRAADHPEAESASDVATVCRRYVELLSVELASPERSMRIFPGVKALLDLLDSRLDAVVGLLTGNLAEGAALKLDAAGIDPGRFRVGAFGSDSSERAELPVIAVRRAVPLVGHEATGQDIVIIGDTPADIACGESLGVRGIGVATGAYSTADLLAAGAFRAFDSFANAAPVIDAIYA